jgi:hypothetical protein
MSNNSQTVPMIFADNFIDHHSIGWRIEQAVEDPNNPLLEPEGKTYPWESASPCTGHGTVLKDPIDGLFKAWVVSLEEDVNYKRGQIHFRLCHFQSEDGVNWTRPMLDISPYPGFGKTNILLGYESGGRATYASVFVEPEKNPDEPYEMFCYRDPMWKNPGFCVPGLHDKPIDDVALGYATRYGLYRYRSKDGLHWRPVEGPINFKSGDTLNVHRGLDGGYVAHHKNGVPAFAGGFYAYDVGAGECRINLRKTSPDGSNWSDSAVIMMPDYMDHQGDQIMEVGHYPYGKGIIGLTAIYHAHSQRMDLQWAGSTDGIKWWRPERQACLPNGMLGDYGGGMIWPTRTMIEHEGRWYIYYGALDGLHGDVYLKYDNCLLFHGAFCRASWEVGRLWAAMQAAGGMEMEGYLTTKPEAVEGKALYVNAKAQRQGCILAELRTADGKVIDGYSRDDCTPIVGDEKCLAVRWKSHEVCPQGKVSVRFYLRDAFLYGYDWR